jgi:uncharacterized membrane protein
MRSKAGAGILLIAVFLLGGVAGGIAHYIYRDQLGISRSSRPRIATAHDIADEMAQSLNLDSEQKEQLRLIIRQSTESYGALSRQFRPQYEKIRNDTNSAIRAILNPEQLLQFEATLNAMEGRHRDHTHESAPSK